MQCSSADGDRLVRWDSRDAAFFFRKQVCQRFQSCCRRESFGTIEAGVASLTRIPLDALQVKAALPPNVLTINQYSIPPILLHSITPLAAALLLPLSQQLSRVLTAVAAVQLAKCYTTAWS